MKNSKYKEVFTKWKKAKQILTSETPPKNVYFVHHGAKIRYIDPLINGERISKINKKAQELINNNLFDPILNLLKISINRIVAKSPFSPFGDILFNSL